MVDAKDAEAEEKKDKAVDDEAEAEEKGDKAVDDEAEKMIAEAEDRVAKAWVPSDIKLEIVDGEKEGSRWLIVDDTHICYQNNVKGKKGENRRWKVDSIRWECSKRRHMGCPFQIFTSLPENGAPIKALSMKKPQVHTCSAEKLTPLMHKFRLKLASRMQDDLDLSWTKIWNEERQLLLEEVKDQPGLLQQVILEMGDAELFLRTGKFSSESKLFGGCHPCSRATSATLVYVSITHAVTLIVEDVALGQRSIWPETGWQKLRGSTGGTRRKVWTRTKILSPNIRYFVAN